MISQPPTIVSLDLASVNSGGVVLRDGKVLDEQAFTKPGKASERNFLHDRAYAMVMHQFAHEAWYYSLGPVIVAVEDTRFEGKAGFAHTGEVRGCLYERILSDAHVDGLLLVSPSRWRSRFSVPRGLSKEAKLQAYNDAAEALGFRSNLVGRGAIDATAAFLLGYLAFEATLVRLKYVKEAPSTAAARLAAESKLWIKEPS